MPEEIKKENYSNLSGINRKMSQYLTGNQYSLDIVNADFYNPGAYTKRWGTTFYLGGPNRINGLFEFTNLSGNSNILIGSSTNMYGYNGTASFIIQQGLTSNSFYSYVSFVDHAFFCDGNNFLKYHGNTMAIQVAGSSGFGSSKAIFDCWNAGLPAPGISSYYCMTDGSSRFFTGLTLQNVLSGSLGGLTYIPSATYTYSYAFINSRGFVGPVTPPVAHFVGDTTVLVIAFDGSMSRSPISGNSTIGFVLYPSFGIGASNLTSFGLTNNVSFIGDYASVAIFRDNGPGTARFRIGFVGTIGAFSGQFGVINYFASDFYDYGPGTSLSFKLGSGGLQSTFPEPTNIYISQVPSFFDVYNNQLFKGGFKQFPSVVNFSDIGEPESDQPANNFEVRTNDGDYLTAFKTYQSQLFMFKSRSFHALSGDNPTNFSIRQISDQYGCLNFRSVVTFEDKMVFLDRKGIALYNGAQPVIMSNPVEDIFYSMNQSAAVTNAIMMHNRPQNQIWCSIPVNGATLNNITVVFDYLSNAWTTFKGFQPNYMAMMRANQTKETPFYADYSGSIYNFGQSLFADCSSTNVTGISVQILTRFQSDQGESTQKLFRRLWTNITPASTNTAVITGKVFKDYDQTTVAATFSLGATTFQYRTEFGISAKSIAIQYNHFSSTDPFVLQGFALGNRFLRNV